MIQYDKRLVSKKELKSVCGIPYTPQHIGRLERAGKFLKRVNFGPGRVARLQRAAMIRWISALGSSHWLVKSLARTALSTQGLFMIWLQVVAPRPDRTIS